MFVSSYKHKGYGSCMTTIVWSRHSEAKREKQELPIEIQRTTFKRTHVNNVNFKSHKHKRHISKKQTKTNKRLNCKSKRIKTKQHSNTYTSQKKGNDNDDEKWDTAICKRRICSAYRSPLKKTKC